MGIKIEELSVKDLGPIKSFKAKFGLFNLIFSRNEKGKTFLTEFIVRSLFGNISRWDYLREGGRGKVLVSGLDGNLVEFSPSSREKLEDYWEEAEGGLPAPMAKLLVVKGGETEIDESQGGISKFLIKEVLSGINILDKIDSDNNISKTVKSAEISEGKIAIYQQGEGKQYNRTRKELESINKLFDEIESQYSEGVLKTYKVKKDNLIKKIETLNQAKRHRAYLISENIRELERELVNIPEDELNKLETDLSLYVRQKEEYGDLEKKYNEAISKGKHFDWLENAHLYYKDLTTRVVKKPPKILLILSGILTISGIILIIFGQGILATVLFLSALILSFIYIKKIYDFLKENGKSKELEKLKEEFKKRVGVELTDVALLESILKKYGQLNSQSKLMGEQLIDLDRKIKELYFSIEQSFRDITGEEIEEKDWNTKISDLKKKNKILKNKIYEKNKELSELGVAESDYLAEDIEGRYSQQEYDKARLELKDISQKIEMQENKLNSLKHKVCIITGDDLSITWDELIESLRQKKQDTQEELREITAKIAAGTLVHKIISNLRKEEDTKIQSALDSDIVLRPLKDITQRYNRLELEGDRLIVSDDYDSFDLINLSTGAKEQVMLALRIGFSSKLLGKDSIFLLLDDAFQHSDWQKREILINKLEDIAREGWQIIYLTMDNHIKDLFDKVGRKFENGQYISLEL